MANLPLRIGRYCSGVLVALALLASSAVMSCKDGAHSQQVLVARDQPWSVRMAESEMRRRADSFLHNDSAKSAWVYETGVFLKGLEQIWRQTGDEKYFAYVKTVADSYIEAEGKIKTYEITEYNLDNINCGKLLLALYNHTREEKYKQAAFLLMQQIATQPRTKEGGFWHKKIYPWQMWLDGIYMSAPFYAEFARTFEQPAAFDDIANQIIFVASHTHDSTTGLFYHGWDESKQQRWADPVTGCSPNFWARAMGWYAMGIVEVLDFMPSDHPQREKILALFRNLAQAAQKYQDEKTGLWYQVMDQGSREGNFLEASASAMFVCALAKAAHNGYLENEFLAVAKKGYQGIIKNLITVEPNGLVNLTQVCQVAGLGGNPYRDGSYEYYISTPVVSNDLKGVGPFIMASVEMERLRQPDKKSE